MNEETFDILDVYSDTIRSYISHLTKEEASNIKVVAKLVETFITNLELDERFKRGPLAEFVLMNHLKKADWEQIASVCIR